MPFRANIIFMNTNAQPAIAEFDLPVTLMTASTRASNPLSPAETPLDEESCVAPGAGARPRSQILLRRHHYWCFLLSLVCEPQAAARQCALLQHRAQQAQAAGFRPCKKCKPTADQSAATAGRPIDKIRAHIERNLDRAVKLEELGRIAGMSPFTVQRLFKSEMGVSPLQYQRALRANSCAER